MRGIFEGPEWKPSRDKVWLYGEQAFDDAFRWVIWHIAVEPRVATTQFLSDDHRILRTSLPSVIEVWVYFRIEPGDENCTLLWMEGRGVGIH
jgi:hypothetical protein